MRSSWRSGTSPGPSVQKFRTLIDSDWGIEQPWSDMGARFVIGDEDDKVMHKMFPNTSAFKNFADMTMYRTKAAAIYKQHTSKVEDSKVGTDDVCQTSKKRKAEQLKAALAKKLPAKKAKAAIQLDN